MEFLLNSTEDLFKDIGNYFHIEESSDMRKKYFDLETRIKRTLHDIKKYIVESNDPKNRNPRSIVKNFFVSSSTLMDLTFEFYNMYYKMEKDINRYNTFLVALKNDLSEDYLQIIDLSWYKDVGKLRNKIIHESQEVTVLETDRLKVQRFDKFEYPMLISDLMDDKFYVDFTLFMVNTLNNHMRLLKIIFDRVLTDHSIHSISELDDVARRTLSFMNHDENNELFDVLYKEILEVRNHINLEKAATLKYFREFRNDEKSLNKLISELQTDKYLYLGDFFKSDVYLKLAVLKYNKRKFRHGVDLLWKGYKYNQNTTFISNIMYGLMQDDDGISDVDIQRMDNHIEEEIPFAFRSMDYNFFSNASSYYEGTNRLEKAREIAYMGFGIAPMHYDPLLAFTYAGICYKLGDFLTARKAYEKVIEWEPKDKEAHLGLIKCLWNLNEISTLNDILINSMKYFPNDGEFLDYTCQYIKSLRMNELMYGLREGLEKAKKNKRILEYSELISDIEACLEKLK